MWVSSPGSTEFVIHFLPLLHFLYSKDGAVKHVGQMLCMRMKTGNQHNCERVRLGENVMRPHCSFSDLPASAVSILQASARSTTPACLDVIEVVQKSVLGNEWGTCLVCKKRSKQPGVVCHVLIDLCVRDWAIDLQAVFWKSTEKQKIPRCRLCSRMNTYVIKKKVYRTVKINSKWTVN